MNKRIISVEIQTLISPVIFSFAILFIALRILSQVDKKLSESFSGNLSVASFSS